MSRVRSKAPCVEPLKVKPGLTPARPRAKKLIVAPSGRLGLGALHPLKSPEDESLSLSRTAGYG